MYKDKNIKNAYMEAIEIQALFNKLLDPNGNLDLAETLCSIKLKNDSIIFWLEE